MSVDSLRRLFRGSSVCIVTLTALLLMSLSPLVPTAGATTNPGLTQGVVNPGQVIRDASSAVPIFGISMTAPSVVERLIMVTVTFSGFGWTAGNDRDLRRLDRDPRISGVGIFRDTGTVNDVLDTSDVPVVMASGPTWSGNDAVFDFNAGGGTIESIPNTASSFHWLIIIRTSVGNPGDLFDGQTITATIRANEVVATSDLVFTSQPAMDTSAFALTVDRTTGVDIVGNSGFRWIGPSSSQVNAKPVLGMHIVDGGIGTNRGISDGLTALTFRLTETGGAVSSGDLWPISTNPAASGIALYRDDGTTSDAWDALDTGMVPASIGPSFFPAGGTDITMTFTSPGLDIPDSSTGNFDFAFFLVVRSGGIVSGDSFRFDIEAQDLRVQGLLAPLAGSVDADLRTPSAFIFSSDVQGDSTPPMTIQESWFTGSNFLFPRGLDLHFGHSMASDQSAYAIGFASDGEAGLANATYTQEPSLAFSPGVQVLAPSGWQLYFGEYRFNAISTSASSPADVTIYDRVGNRFVLSNAGRNYRYFYETSKIIILPDPGWSVAAWGLWVNPATGKLWFSNQFFSPATASLGIQVASLSGYELTTLSASAEPTLGGPTPSALTFGAGTFSAAWSTAYTVNATATGTNAPAAITAMDNQGNSVTANFDYGLDTTGPAITFLNPSNGNNLNGQLLVRASVLDANTAVSSVYFQVDTGWTFGSFFDGTAYFAAIPTSQIPDGPHRLTVVALDVLGNVNALGMDITILNGADVTPPSITSNRPAMGAYLQGVQSLNVTATDNVGVTSAAFAVARTSDGTQVASGNLAWTVGSYWLGSWNTSAVQDGDYRITLTALDGGGLRASATIDIHVNNAAPTLAVVTPVANVIVEGLYVISASASGGVASVDVEVRRASDNALVHTAPLALADSGYYQSTLDTAGLEDGDYNAVVTVKDVTGMTTTASVAMSIDNHAPTLQVSAPAGGSYLSGNVLVAASAVDAHLDLVQYSVDGGPWVSVSTQLDTTRLADGTHDLQVRATDDGGRVTSWQAEVVVDNTAPTSSLSSLASGQTLQGVHSYRVFAGDAVGIRSVTLTVAGQTVPMAYNAQTGYYEYTVDTATWADGSYTAQATVTDIAGRESTTPATSFVVKNRVEDPPPGPIAIFESMLPMLSFILGLVAFITLLGVMKSGALARWMRPRREEPEPPMVHMEDAGIRPPTPPPNLPPPGAP